MRLTGLAMVSVWAPGAPKDPDQWMVVGLGNPGPRYAATRHNVGFMLVDELARAEGIAVDRLQENAQVGRGRMFGKKLLLAKPMTFMNVSGEAVGRLARFYRVPPQRVLVVYDDLDLPTAAVRLRAKGGHGGHNGMKSITQHLGGSKDFPRLRMGIGRPTGSMPIASYVLQDFSRAEREEIDIAIQEGLDILRAVLSLGMDKAVSGLRVDRHGNTTAPAPHQNGKGVKAAKEGSAAGEAPAQQQRQHKRPREQQQQEAGASEPQPATAAAAAGAQP
eukprot:scaffold14.g1242.t1